MVRTLVGLSATNPATIMNPDPEAPLVAVALENFLGAAAVMLRHEIKIRF